MPPRAIAEPVKLTKRYGYSVAINNVFIAANNIKISILIINSFYLLIYKSRKLSVVSYLSLSIALILYFNYLFIKERVMKKSLGKGICLPLFTAAASILFAATFMPATSLAQSKFNMSGFLQQNPDFKPGAANWSAQELMPDMSSYVTTYTDNGLILVKLSLEKYSKFGNHAVLHQCERIGDKYIRCGFSYQPYSAGSRPVSYRVTYMLTPPSYYPNILRCSVDGYFNYGYQECVTKNDWRGLLN